MSGTAWDGPRFRPPSVVVLLAPVLLSLLVQVPAAVVIALATTAGPGPAAGQITLAAIGPLALLAARRYPGITVAVVSAAALADLLLTPDVGPPYVSIAFAIVLAVVRGSLAWALASVGAAWLIALVLAPTVGLAWSPPRIAVTTIALALCFAAGWVARTRRQRALAERDAAQRRRREAEEAERLRVANELHDVLGHSLSLINVQAGVALHLLERNPGHARGALEHIKAASGAALAEVRGVLGVLRSDTGAPLLPQQGLAELERLAAGVRSAGIEVAIEDPSGLLAAVSGDVPWPVQAAAYRIVQEALTNVLRHAGARRTSVELEREPGGISITVSDDGRGFGDQAPTGGLLSMRSRAELLGGQLEVGASPAGGTRVRAILPWEISA